MRRLIALLACLMAASPVAAEWPTTSYIPIPAGDPPFDGLNNPQDLTVETLNRSQLMQGAFAVLTDVMRLAAIDSTRLESAGFPSPLIQPLITVSSTGDRYFPIRWENGLGAPAQQGCYVSRSGLTGNIVKVLFTLEFSNARFGYSNIAGGYNAGGRRRNRVLDQMSATVTHEVVHGIQNRSWKDPETCDGPSPPKWYSEGTADGIAHYLLFSRRPDAAEEYGAGRNQRRWDESLDSTGQSIGNAYTYETGSFFRYLMEASESSPGNGLAVMKSMLAISPSDLGSRVGVLRVIENAVKSQSGGRGLYQVLPEFFTEYGSYGVGRYKIDLSSPDSSSPLTHERWLDKSFGGCVEFNLTPGNTVNKRVRIDDLAAECIHVTWSGFTMPVALQIFADALGDDHGALHLGEAVRKSPSGMKYCYDKIKGLKPRLGRKMTEKCMMRRETDKVGESGETGLAVWTSDFNLHDDGEVYLILSNVAKDVAKTKEISVGLMVGAVDVKSPNPAKHVEAREGAGLEPTQDGKTDVDQRVHAMSGNEERMLLDARTVFAESIGLGFLEGIEGQGNIGNGVLSMVRGSNYWIGFVDAAGRRGKDSAFVIKNPRLFEQSGYTEFAAGASVGGGPVKGKKVQKCGYKMSADITVLEKNDKNLKFRIVVDLFDLRMAMGSMFTGGGSECDIMRKAHVETVDFTVSLPYGKIYDGKATIQRANPPGQALYNNTEFLPGPNIGGIDTSAQLAGTYTPDNPPQGQPGAGPGASPGGPGGPAGGPGAAPSTAPPSGGSGGHIPQQCTCKCPRTAIPMTDTCIMQCISTWQTCRGR